MKTIFSYNQSEVNTDGSLEDLANGYNVWVDFADPDHQELMTVATKFNLDRMLSDQIIHLDIELP